MKFFFPMMLFALLAAAPAVAQVVFEKDVIKTTAGNLEITFIGHGSLMMNFNKTIIHIDPYGKLADYGKLPKADLILITHEHQDHLDPAAIGQVRTENTKIVLTGSGSEKLPGDIVMKNGDVRTVAGIRIEAVPAYNLVHKRESGEPFHPKGRDNGYVLTFGDKRIYVAGDTENMPEMKALKEIDIAFLPMNLPYTMTPEMVADAAAAFRPKVLYPYHYGESDLSKLLSLLKGNNDIDVRIKKMK